MSNPFNRLVNWFQLSINRETIYKIKQLDEKNPPEKYFINYESEFYLLEPTGSCEEVEFSGELRKRVIAKAFRDALEKKDFLFKGRFDKIAYHSKSNLNTQYKDVFGIHTGFEYSVWQNFDGESIKDYLVIDPHVALVVNASIYNLCVEGKYGRKINIEKLKNYAVRVNNEDTKKHNENHSGIDGILIDGDWQHEVFRCHILDARTGETHLVSADEVYLEPRPEVIRDVILKELGIVLDIVKTLQEKSFLVSDAASKDRLLKTLEIVNQYLCQAAKIFPLDIGGNEVTVSPKLTIIKGIGYPKGGALKESQLLFDKADSSAVHLQPYHGLRSYGSYTKDKSEIRVALLGTKHGIGHLRQLVENLNKGTSIMPEGMPRFFNTSINIVEQEVVDTDTLKNYVDKAESLSLRCQNGNSNVETALIHIPQPTSEFNYNTPYYNVKPILLENNITSQFITQKTLQNPAWSYSNIGSAIFAKTGAYPWVLAEDIQDFDMIIGIGLSQAISMTNRAGAKPRYLGYANVFDKQGRWMFFETTSELYDKDDPVSQLKNVVGRAVTQYQRIKLNLPKSIAIHYFQRFSEAKIAAVNEILLEKLGKDYRVALITIDKSHAMRLYDTNITDCSYPRTHFALLNENRILLSTTGFTDLAKKRLGTPQILNITARQYPNDFIEIDKIAKHILALTRLNYKTLTPVVGEPVTLLFANLAAKFMAAFSETQFSNARNISSNKINSVPWFL